MGNFIRNIATGLLVTAASVGGAANAWAAAEETPIITFKTNIYDQYGETNQFGVVLGVTETGYYDIDTGFGSEEYEVGPAVFNQETQAIEGTYVACRVNSEGIVKIYGDASKIDYINATGCYIDWIDMDACTNLSILNLEHNELKRLDLSPFSKLQAIYLSDNTFTAETPLKVGGNKPDLMILEIDIIDHLDQSFNLSDYPALVAFDGYHNFGLYNVDPTGCPDLQTLSIEMAPVSSLDVSQNTELRSLNISETRITSIDVRNNTKLESLLAEHLSGTVNTGYYLSEIDLSNNPNLIRLALGGNRLKTIDVSNNPNLVRLWLNRNQLTSINIDSNESLSSFNLAYNDFDYVTLPLPQSTWTEYYYYRDPMPCERSYAVGTPIDFSSRVIREGTTTSVRVWKNPRESEPELLDEANYTYADGKVTFNAAQTDSIYIEYLNSAFYDENAAFTGYTIRTAQFVVKNADEMGLPSKVLAFTPASSMAGQTLAMKVGLDNASDSEPATFYVDLGDGVQMPFQATTIGLPESANVAFTVPQGAGEVSVYLPEGASMTALAIDGARFSSIDLKSAYELRCLALTNCNLSSVDLSYNRCLQTLDLSGNRLTLIDLAGVYGDYEKTVLKDINLSNNRLVSFSMPLTPQITKLDLSNNMFTTFNLKDFDGLEYLDLSNNRISDELSLTYLSNAIEIDINSNRISNLTLVDMPNLQRFDIANNNLTIATLPTPSEMPASAEYTYAPQKDITIIDHAPGVNLSEQYREIDGVGTTFTWKKLDGTELVNGRDLVCTNGATRFLDENLGIVYCEIKHAAFPALVGENVLKTTETTVVGAPTIMVASFNVTETTDSASVTFTGSKVSALYIDWRGDGTEYIQYPIESENYTTYANQVAYAGATAKVYTYDSAEDITVFSIAGVKMSSMDASPLTNLITFTVNGAGLGDDQIVMPASEGLRELSLANNNFSSKNFSNYSNLSYLVLSDNAYKSFDASAYPNLELLMIGGNDMTEITFDNPHMWGLSIESNAFTTLSFNGLPALTQVNAFNNDLTSIDLGPNKSNIIGLNIQGNAFTFATLPKPSELNSNIVYYYANQQAVDAECVGGKVDLSDQASVDGYNTTYVWYLGTPVINTDTAELEGELLVSADDDPENPEYEVSNGITSFYYTFDDHVTGLMTNELFPSLALFTNPVTVDRSAGVDNVAVDNDANMPVDVYSLSGVKLRSQVLPSDATKGLAPGIYIVGSAKVLVR